MYFIILFLLSLFGLFLLGVPPEILFVRGIIGLTVFGFYLWIMTFPKVQQYFEVVKEDRDTPQTLERRLGSSNFDANYLYGEWFLFIYVSDIMFHIKSYGYWHYILEC